MCTEEGIETSLSRKPAIYPEEIEFLQRLFMNSDKFVFEVQAAKMCMNGPVVEAPDTLRVASIAFGMPNPNSHIREGALPERVRLDDHGKYHFVRFPAKSNDLSSQEIVDIVSACLRRAEKEDAPLHFLLLNELALSYDDSETLLKKLRHEFQSREMRTTIGILGSYHCAKTFFNVSTVITPFLDDASHEIIGRTLKQNSAKKQHERIRTPDGTSFLRYDTPYGLMMVWVCLDMYDPNLVLKLLRTNYRLAPHAHPGQVIDMLFIPSYNADRKQNVLNIAQMISKFCRMAVFVCNDSKNLPDRDGWNDNMCFYMGKKVKGCRYDGNESSKCNISVFELEDWPNRHARVSGPYPDESSSLFGQILGLQAGSMQQI